MNNTGKNPTAIPALVLAAAILAGCATRMPPSRRAYVYIAENTAITFNGDTFMRVDQLPQKLLKAGATPENEILIIPQGKVPEAYLKSIISACGRNGLPNVVIREDVAPVSFAQKLGTGIEKQPGATPPRVVTPAAKREAARNRVKELARDGWDSERERSGNGK